MTPHRQEVWISPLNFPSAIVDLIRSISRQKQSAAAAGNQARELRQHFGLTQTELAHAVGISLRTVQNWEREGAASRPRQLRDLEELWTILRVSMKDADIPDWLRSKSDAFAGQRPIDLLKDGKARDIIVEFRRLQAGEPACGWAALRASSSTT